MLPKTTLISLSLLVLAACATAPSQYQFDNYRSFDTSMDDIWTETVEFFAENNLPISTIERDSGLIVSDNLRISMAEFYRYADCGDAPLTIESNGHGDVNVFAQEQSADRTRVTVNAKFQVYRTFGEYGGYSQCVSNGNLENAIMERIATGINLPTVNF